jgi:caspase domain-containing protein
MGKRSIQLLRSAASKQTLILDCCRKKSPAIPSLLTDSMRFAKRGPAVNPEECRKYYDKCIEDCARELVVMHACSIGEVAGDDEQKGGYYSHSLLGASGAWVESVTIDTSRQYKSRSVAEAHNAAVPRVRQISGNRQTPSIEKPRTGPYYPFCIVA